MSNKSIDKKLNKSYHNIKEKKYKYVCKSIILGGRKMKKLINILVLIVAFCIIGTINVYAAAPTVMLEGDATAKAGETKTLEVRLKADEDMRRNTV